MPPNKHMCRKEHAVPHNNINNEDDYNILPINKQTNILQKLNVPELTNDHIKKYKEA